MTLPQFPDLPPSKLPRVIIATDGACKGNPGPGGWGAVLRMGTKEKELSGSEAHTTNNRMELMAAIQALAALTKPCHVTLTTDSVYVRDGITKWVHGWVRKGWRTADNKYREQQRKLRRANAQRRAEVAAAAEAGIPVDQWRKEQA